MSQPSNRMSICSAVFAEIVDVTNRQTDTHTDRPRHCVCKNRPHVAIATMRTNNIITTKCRIVFIIFVFVFTLPYDRRAFTGVPSFPLCSMSFHSKYPLKIPKRPGGWQLRGFVSTGSNSFDRTELSSMVLLRCGD